MNAAVFIHANRCLLFHLSIEICFRAVHRLGPIWAPAKNLV